MKKFLFLALFCALAANCDESAPADKASAAGKTDKTTSIGETATQNAHFIKSGEASAGCKAAPMRSSKRTEFRGRICKAVS
nr:hypothetical protein [uncultured Campylobacter sp.]